MTPPAYPSEETTDIITAAALGRIEPSNLEELAEHFINEAQFLRSAAQRLTQRGLISGHH